jgi:ferredoxin-NADP reductase
MFGYIDRKLNGITMYRMAMYYLVAILMYVVVLGNMGYIKYDSFYIVFSVFYITLLTVIFDIFLSKIYKAALNTESSYITALILSFIITPPQSLFDGSFLWFAFLASLFAVASKYVFAIKKKHIFNPAAIAVLIAGVLSGQAASWWVGNVYIVPIVLIMGLFLIKKISRFTMVIVFLATVIISLFITHSSSSFSDILNFVNKVIFYSPVLFFAFVMLTEPITSPSSMKWRAVYAVVVGFLFNPLAHIGTLYFTPEMALITGNIFAYFVNPKTKAFLVLKEKILISKNTYSFIFKRGRQFNFEPGQYMEWTLPHKNADNRGNRRYFTIASSPKEKDINIGVKFYQNGSSFKRSLINMTSGDSIVASQVAGDFTLPDDKNEKLVFLAGGIGITPFISMIKGMIDTKERRDIVLLYSNKTLEDVAYVDTLKESENFGINVNYIITDKNEDTSSYDVQKGYIDMEMIKRLVPDYKDRTFYISGPHSMVAASKKMLHKLGLKNKQIKSDFFPGF